MNQKCVLKNAELIMLESMKMKFEMMIDLFNRLNNLMLENKLWFGDVFPLMALVTLFG